MSLQKVLDKSVYCPLSGFKFKLGTVKPHAMQLIQCANGTLFARCSKHNARVFISAFETVDEVMAVSKVTSVREGPVQKERKYHGPTKTS